MKRISLTCIVTGRSKVFSQSLLAPKVKKYGSIEDLQKYYVCKEAKKLFKKGSTVKQIREELKCKTDLPDVDIEALFKLKLIKSKNKKPNKSRDDREKYLASDAYKQKASLDRDRTYSTAREYIEWATGGPNGSQVKMGGTCMRPDIFIDNDYYCDECWYYEHCMCSQKRLQIKK